MLNAFSRDPPLPRRALVSERLGAANCDPHANPNVGILDPSVLLCGGFSHLERRSHGAECVILVGDRDAEGAHDRVAHELLDRSSVPLDRYAHRLEVGVEHSSQELGVQTLPQLGRTYKIAVKSSNEAATCVTRG